MSFGERRIRFLVHFVVAYFSRHKTRFLITAISLLLLAFLTLQFLPRFLSTRNTYVEGLVGTYSQQSLPDRITALISSGLTKAEKNGEIRGELAQSWEILEDGKVYRFHLKENLSWQDGSLFDPKDAVFSIDGVEINYIDKKTIDFRLTQPFSPLPSLLIKPIFKNRSLTGTGIYKVQAIKKKGEIIQEVVLVPANQKNPLTKDLHRIIFKIYPTFNQAILGFKQGEVQALASLPQLNSLANWLNIEIEKTVDFRSVVTIFLNTKKEQFSKKEVRHALARATNPDNFRGQRAISSIGENSWTFNTDLTPYEYSPEKAKKTISESNTKIGKISFVTLPLYQKLAEKIADDWRKIGLDVEIKIENSIPTDFDVFLAGQEVPVDPDQYSLWHSTQEATNLTRISSPRIDKLLEDGRKFHEQNTRKEKYAEFQRVIADEEPAIFLYHPDEYFVYWKKAKGKIESLSKFTRGFPHLDM